VIIGDPNQLKHISGISPRQDRALLEQHGLVTERGAWSYSTTSLFDLATTLARSEDIVVLRDHHRSHADIIGFSNEYFYEGKLRVATKYPLLKPRPPGYPAIRWIDVRGEVRRPSEGGAINRVEVDKIVSELRRIAIENRYKGTIGVVSPFRAQANAIREAINGDDTLSQALMGCDFLADTVHRFQGDERDLMIFSPAVADKMPDGALNFLRGNGNLFNVAITRARSALVVVGDLAAAEKCGIPYLESFADYVQRLGSPSAASNQSFEALGPEYPVVARPETVSSWEKVFYRALYRAGIRPLPQYDVDQYTLDFALIKGDRRLDVEVDGEMYHRAWDGELSRRDQIRNQRLMELGWDVMRFWVYQIRDDLNGAVTRVQRWIGSANELKSS
jgi:very-short-patch-repair endonuclease